MSPNGNSEFAREALEALPHPTPFFLFSKSVLLRQLTQFAMLFPESALFYAMKANSESQVLRVLGEAGSGFEAASVCELHQLKALGVSPDRIIYGSAIKPAEGIREFHESGVNTYAFDSRAELEKLAAIAPKSRVFVRVAVNDRGSVFKFSEKFGTEVENVVPLLQGAQEHGLKPYGISFHVGSQATDPTAWAQALDRISHTIGESLRAGIRLEAVNIGGGFPCNYSATDARVSLEEIARRTLDQYERLPHRLKLVLEPGRAIVAEAGVLITTVVAKLTRRGKTWLFLDAGVYNALFEALACQGATRYRVQSLRANHASSDSSFALAGPTGDGLDVLTRTARLPVDIRVGDRLAIHDTGAYSLALSSRFNGFSKPDVYLE